MDDKLFIGFCWKADATKGSIFSLSYDKDIVIQALERCKSEDAVTGDKWVYAVDYREIDIF